VKKGSVRTKQEQAAIARAEHKRRMQRTTLMRRGAGILAIVAAAGGVGYCVMNERALTGAVTTASYPAGQHTAGPVTYRETPPVGGLHNVVWQNCGIYDAPIHNEHAVHALEHGAVWITYRPGLDAAAIDRLKTAASDDYMLLSPYPGLQAPVVASAWNHQIELEGADDPRLRQFITRYKNNPSTTPEFGATCSGGTSATASMPLGGYPGGSMN
jgi:hypothetical protein